MQPGREPQTTHLDLPRLPAGPCPPRSDPGSRPRLRARLAAPLLLATALVAQQPRISFQEVRLETSRDAGGLTCIMQDREGFIWIGGRLGVWRLDGHRVERLPAPVSAQSRIPVPAVKHILQDDDGVVWIASHHGVARFDPASRSFVPTAFWKAPGKYERLFEPRFLTVDSRGDLWTGSTAGRIYCLESGGHVRGPLSLKHLDLGSPNVHLFRLPDGRLAALSAAGVLAVAKNSDAWDRHDLRPKLGTKSHASERLDIYPVGRTAWLARGDQLWELDLETFEVLRGPLTRGVPGEPTDWLNAVCVGPAGLLWMGTSKGVASLDLQTGHSRSFGHDPVEQGSPPPGQVSRVFLDRDGALWVLCRSRVARGDVRPGIARYDPVIDGVSGKPFSPRGLRFDPRNRIWITGLVDGLLVLDRERDAWLRPLPQDGRFQRIGCITESGPDRFWLATKTSILEIEAEGFKVLREIPVAGKHRKIQALHWDGRRLWVGTPKHLLMLDPVSRKTHIVPLLNPRGIMPGGILPGRDGQLWLCRILNGLARLDPQTLQLTPFEIDIPGTSKRALSQVFDVEDTGKGPLLVATGAGAVTLDLESGAAHFADHRDSVGSHTTSLTRDASGNYWVGTTHSGVRYLNEDLMARQAAPNWVDYRAGRHYAGSSAAGPRDEIALGAANGIIVVDAASVPHRPSTLHLRVTGLAVNGTRRDLGAEAPRRLALEAGDNTLAFKFSAFDFISPSGVEYQYRLEGFDEDWVDADTEPVARYTNLPAGSYRLKIRARQRSGIWTAHTWPHEVVIARPLLERTWFRTLLASVALAIIALYVAYAYRLGAQGRRLKREYHERLRAEAEARSLEQRLQHSQKMEAVGRLAGGVAHDFNNILTAIIAQVESVRDEMIRRSEGGTVAGAALDDIEASAMRAARLTGQLLAFSRQQPTTPRVLDLNEVISGMEPMIRRLMREDIRVAVNLGDELPSVLIDPSQVEQVVLNLCVNASDAMKDGGVLTIETSRDGAEDQVLLKVRDTGHGMDAETAKRVFEPFFTTKPVGSGTGLGLSTVHGIVVQSGGHLEIESAPGEGTTVTIRVPATDHALTEVPGRDLPQGGQGESILVCEDDSDVRRLVCVTLERHGYRVVATGDPAEALRLASGKLGDIELLLTDVVMPGMNGIRLAQQLTQRNPSIPVLYMSGYTADVLDQQNVDSDNIDLLEKPFHPSDLLHRVGRALSRARTESSATHEA